MRFYRSLRRGATTVQYCVIVALIGLVAIAGVSLLGTRASTKLGQTATDVATPKSLTARFKK